MGTVADLLGTVGTSSITATVDCYIERLKGRLPDEIRPLFYQEYGFRGPVDPTTVLSLDLERANDLSYKRLYHFAGNTTTAAGVPFSGDAANAVTSDITLDDGATPPVLNNLFDVMQRQNREDYSLETRLNGWGIIDLVRDGSHQSAVYSGDRARLQEKWTTGTLGTTPQITVGYEGYRTIR